MAIESIGEKIENAKRWGCLTESEEGRVCALAKGYYDHRISPESLYIPGDWNSDREYGEIIVYLERAKIGKERFDIQSQPPPATIVEPVRPAISVYIG